MAKAFVVLALLAIVVGSVAATEVIEEENVGGEEELALIEDDTPPSSARREWNAEPEEFGGEVEVEPNWTDQTEEQSQKKKQVVITEWGSGWPKGGKSWFRKNEKTIEKTRGDSVKPPSIWGPPDVKGWDWMSEKRGKRKIKKEKKVKKQVSVTNWGFPVQNSWDWLNEGHNTGNDKKMGKQVTMWGFPPGTSWDWDWPDEDIGNDKAIGNIEPEKLKGEKDWELQGKGWDNENENDGDLLDNDDEGKQVTSPELGWREEKSWGWKNEDSGRDDGDQLDDIGDRDLDGRDKDQEDDDSKGWGKSRDEGDKLGDKKIRTGWAWKSRPAINHDPNWDAKLEEGLNFLRQKAADIENAPIGLGLGDPDAWKPINPPSGWKPKPSKGKRKHVDTPWKPIRAPNGWLPKVVDDEEYEQPDIRTPLGFEIPAFKAPLKWSPPKGEPGWSKPEIRSPPQTEPGWRPDIPIPEPVPWTRLESPEPIENLGWERPNEKENEAVKGPVGWTPQSESEEPIRNLGWKENEEIEEPIGNLGWERPNEKENEAVKVPVGWTPQAESEDPIRNLGWKENEEIEEPIGNLGWERPNEKENEVVKGPVGWTQENEAPRWSSPDPYGPIENDGPEINENLGWEPHKERQRGGWNEHGNRWGKGESLEGNQGQHGDGWGKDESLDGNQGQPGIGNGWGKEENLEVNHGQQGDGWGKEENLEVNQGQHGDGWGKDESLDGNQEQPGNGWGKEENLEVNQGQHGDGWGKDESLVGNQEQPGNGWGKEENIEVNQGQHGDGWGKGESLVGNQEQPGNGWGKEENIEVNQGQHGDGWGKDESLVGNQEQPGNSWGKEENQEGKPPQHGWEKPIRVPVGLQRPQSQSVTWKPEIAEKVKKTPELISDVAWKKAVNQALGKSAQPVRTIKNLIRRPNKLIKVGVDKGPFEWKLLANGRWVKIRQGLVSKININGKWFRVSKEIVSKPGARRIKVIKTISSNLPPPSSAGAPQQNQPSSGGARRGNINNKPQVSRVWGKVNGQFPKVNAGLQKFITDLGWRPVNGGWERVRQKKVNREHGKVKESSGWITNQEPRMNSRWEKLVNRIVQRGIGPKPRHHHQRPRSNSNDGLVFKKGIVWEAKVHKGGIQANVKLGVNSKTDDF